MSRIALIVNGTSYQYPNVGEDPNWGEDATAWSQAVTQVLSTLLAPGDILETKVSINNNTTVLTNVTGMLFDPGTVRAANIDYAIYRTSTSTPSGNSESGTILISYDDSSASGSKWQLSQRINAGAGVSFFITDLGQVQYKATDIGSAGYVGNIVFKAKVLSK